MNQPPHGNQPPNYPNPYPPPAPGQFYYPPAPPPPTLRKYSNSVLLILSIAYGIGWLLFLPSMASSSGKGPNFLANFGLSIFFGVLTCVLIMDWQGSVSLQGLIQWRKSKGAARFILGLLWIGLFPFLLGIYLVRTFILYRRFLQASIQGVVPTRSKRPVVGLVVGSIVTLFLLIVTSAGGTTATQTTSTLGTTITPPAKHAILVSQVTPTVEVTPTFAPTTTATKVSPTPAPTKAPVATPTPKPQPTQLQPTPVPTQPKPTPVPQLSLTFTGASAVDYSYGSVSVHTLPGAALTIVVTYCSRYSATSASLQGTSYANSGGNYTWNWTPQTKCRGAATADVTASLNGQSITQTDNFTVQ